MLNNKIVWSNGLSYFEKNVKTECLYLSYASYQNVLKKKLKQAIGFLNFNGLVIMIS